MMKIYIIGAGAIGKALAVCLNSQGKDMQLIRGSVDDGSFCKEEITLQLNSDSEITAKIEFSTLSNYTKLDGLIVLTNKSYGNETLAKKLKGKIKNSPIVILQNGLGIERPFIENGFPEIYRCVLFATSQNISQNTVSYKPVAKSPIGTIKQNHTQLKTIVNEIDSPNFRFVADDEIQKIIWKKAIANCVFNSICPLLEVDNGIFIRDEDVFTHSKNMIQECILIAKNKGVDIDIPEMEKMVLNISRMSDGQFISTLQDIRNKRETEIDTLNLEISRMAKEMGLEHQILETKLLGELTQLKSKLNR